MVALGHYTPPRMTLDEFRSWDSGDQSGASWELVDGEAMAMAPASERHAAIVAEVAWFINDHLRRNGGPCRLLVEPGVVPNVRANSNFRIPDLGVSCTPPSDDIIVREPVLLIEILSPNNESQTRSNIWTPPSHPSGKSSQSTARGSRRNCWFAALMATGRKWRIC
jgi:Uma2 family endonuclease